MNKKKRSDSGGFQSPEVREKKVKIAKLILYVFGFDFVAKNIEG
jgi:hypothetical protein